MEIKSFVILRVPGGSWFFFQRENDALRFRANGGREAQMRYNFSVERE
jgi:hypothetical protein